MRAMTEADFLPIQAVIDDWWERPLSSLLQRWMCHYFSASSFVIEQDGKLVGFLIGLIDQTKAEAYIHMVGVAPELRRTGLAQQLYEKFFTLAISQQCRTVRAITAPVNQRSIAFHRRMGFGLELGDGEAEGVPVVLDHAGPQQARVCFLRQL
ncbi:MAG: GNAT family N-acetyltransferase [Chloroflexi bacterium]|nr:GNAT family N-acetyltransferase [Chloroflexota bacterium]